MSFDTRFCDGYLTIKPRKSNKRQSITPRASLNNVHHIQNVFQKAVEESDITQVKVLLRYAQTNIHLGEPNKNGRTALQECCLKDDLEMIRLLLDHGASLEATDSYGWTALHYSAFFGSLDIVRFLVLNCADLMLMNNNGETAYDLAQNSEVKFYLQGMMMLRKDNESSVEEEHDDYDDDYFSDDRLSWRNESDTESVCNSMCGSSICGNSISGNSISGNSIFGTADTDVDVTVDASCTTYGSNALSNEACDMDKCIAAADTICSGIDEIETQGEGSSSNHSFESNVAHSNSPDTDIDDGRDSNDTHADEVDLEQKNTGNIDVYDKLYYQCPTSYSLGEYDKTTGDLYDYGRKMKINETKFEEKNDIDSKYLSDDSCGSRSDNGRKFGYGSKFGNSKLNKVGYNKPANGIAHEQGVKSMQSYNFGYKSKGTIEKKIDRDVNDGRYRTKAKRSSREDTDRSDSRDTIDTGYSEGSPPPSPIRIEHIAKPLSSSSLAKTTTTTESASPKAATISHRRFGLLRRDGRLSPKRMQIPPPGIRKDSNNESENDTRLGKEDDFSANVERDDSIKKHHAKRHAAENNKTKKLKSPKGIGMETDGKIMSPTTRKGNDKTANGKENLIGTKNSDITKETSELRQNKTQMVKPSGIPRQTKASEIKGETKTSPKTDNVKVRKMNFAGKEHEKEIKERRLTFKSIKKQSNVGSPNIEKKIEGKDSKGKELKGLDKLRERFKLLTMRRVSSENDLKVEEGETSKKSKIRKTSKIQKLNMIGK
eukprot:Seg1073.5 transcript_id=Seg1073.5/GoldUCD/mRNA.D3Y31 product="Protein phosphatase 1 regulatory subunit 16A" protein_id=Seg1073.5/GoldUCD/D3Y31